MRVRRRSASDVWTPRDRGGWADSNLYLAFKVKGLYQGRLGIAQNFVRYQFDRAWGEDLTQQYKYKSNEAYYTFVALDPNRKPRKVPELIPETEEDGRLYDGALRRRQLRLILGGKMKPDDAAELKALFVKE